MSRRRAELVSAPLREALHKPSGRRPAAARVVKRFPRRQEQMIETGKSASQVALGALPLRTEAVAQRAPRSLGT
jgi:hypothetical protein